MSNELKEIRTYMAFASPIDPVKIITIADMDISYALAGTLVTWDSHKEITSAVASRWDIVNGNTIRFHLRGGLKWSDDTLITSTQVKASFERALKAYPNDLRSLSNMLVKIDPVTNDTVDFVLKSSATESGLLGKLTEPNYGILFVNDSGNIDLSKTAGPFFIEKETKSEVILKKNINWYNASLYMADRIVLRMPKPTESSDTVLLKDTWPNLTETSSMINAEVFSGYENDKFVTWRRPWDKMGHFRLNPHRSNTKYYELFQYLGRKINRQNLFQNLSGFSIADEAFPKGYQLYDPTYSCTQTEVALPQEFRTRPLRILYSPERINSVLRFNIENEIERLTDHRPQMVAITVQEIGTRTQQDDYDLYAGTIGMADPDPEGIMSYYFEGDAPIIPASSENFVEKLDRARTEPDRTKRIHVMSKIMTEATCKGHLLPLYHASTLGIGRSALDFSQIPMTEESVTLSKIRFRK